MKKLMTLLALLLCLTGIKAQNYITINDTSFVTWLQTNIPAAMVGNQMDTTHTDVTSRKRIIIQNKHIHNLDGIQYFDSLQTLDCSMNVYDTINIRVSVIPALPSMLDTLICNNNKLDSLPQLPNGLVMLLCSNNVIDSLPALPSSIKLLECWGNKLTSLPTLPDSLISFNCCNNQITTMPTIPSGLVTFTCSNNLLSGLPVLSNSLTSINCSSNPLHSLPALPTTLSYLDCSGDSLIALPLLPNTLLNLICSANQLTSLPTLPNALQFIDCSSNKLSGLPALPNSLSIINCANNVLGGLPTLPNALYKLISSNNPIGSLPALPNSLVILYCDNNQLLSLPTLPNSLVDLNCGTNTLGTLPTLPNSLNILTCYTDQLVSLPILPSSLGALNCSNNLLDSLSTLPNGLYALDCQLNSIVSLPTLPNSLNSLWCNNNQLSNLPTLPVSLSYLNCSYNNIHCFDPFNPISNYINISNNPFTCLPNYIPSMDSITLDYPLCMAGNPFGCPSSFGIVGYTYKDNNNNCINDSLDRGLKNVPLKIYNSSSTLIGTTYTALNGVYQFLDSANTYNVVVDTIGKPYIASCTYPGLDSTVTVAVLDTNINFALTCKSGFDMGVQSIYSCGVVFPGQTHQLNLNAGDMSKWYNLRCGAGVGGVVTFKVTGPVTYMAAASGALVPSVTGNVFTYSIADFGSVNNATDFQILLQPFPTAQAGDVICVDAKITTTTTGDNNLSNNTYNYCYNVVNSHDPNIKEVYPINVANGFKDWLTYTIHFQNTGNAPAFNINLVDTLDNQLDLTTFQVTDYSHANSTSLIGNKLTVYFANIQLPDSTSNPKGSIGFIQYRLKPKSTWIAPYKIKNTAYIYFDFNAPIITNTTYNTILDITTGVKEEKESQVALYPNPTNGLFNIELNSKEKQNVQLIDIAGNVVLDKTLENGNGTIDASYLAAGIYSVTIKGNSSIINKKIVIVK